VAGPPSENLNSYHNNRRFRLLPLRTNRIGLFPGCILRLRLLSLERELQASPSPLCHQGTTTPLKIPNLGRNKSFLRDILYMISDSWIMLSGCHRPTRANRLLRIAHPTRKWQLLPFTSYLLVTGTAPTSPRMGHLDRCQRAFWPWSQCYKLTS
jgi:hypothetical protein